MKKTNFFIVGAAKSGTTSLYNILDQHPNVYMSPIKEPHYFSKDIKLENFNKEYRERNSFNITAYLATEKLDKKHIAYIDDLNDYIELFREQKNEKCIGEISNGYLFSQEAAKEIYSFNPNAKIIMILRNPIERAFSHWIMGLQIGLVKNYNFLEAVLDDYNLNKKGWGISHTYIELGLYYEQVKRYYDVFPHENIKIFLFDELKNNPEKVYNDLFDFLEIDRQKSIDYKKRYNVTKLPKNKLIKKLMESSSIKNFLSSCISPDMKKSLKNMLLSKNNVPKLLDKDQEKLMPYFFDDIKKLEKLINRNLSIWYRD